MVDDYMGRRERRDCVGAQSPFRRHCAKPALDKILNVGKRVHEESSRLCADDTCNIHVSLMLSSTGCFLERGLERVVRCTKTDQAGRGFTS